MTTRYALFITMKWQEESIFSHVTGCVVCLGGGVLLEAGGHDAVELLVLAPVGHHLVRVRAVVVALQAVEMARALLVST